MEISSNINKYIYEFLDVAGNNENLYKRELIIEKCNKIKQDFFLPTARKVASKTLGSELVAVQPLNGPTGLIHYIDEYNENLYKRNLLIERTKKSSIYYYPNYINRFKSPGVYIRETDFSYVQL